MLIWQSLLLLLCTVDICTCAAKGLSYRKNVHQLYVPSWCLFLSFIHFDFSQENCWASKLFRSQPELHIIHHLLHIIHHFFGKKLLSRWLIIKKSIINQLWYKRSEEWGCQWDRHPNTMKGGLPFQLLIRITWILVQNSPQPIPQILERLNFKWCESSLYQ